MSFAILVLFSAFLIEGIGTYVSVVGLSSIFQADIVIIILAVALDIGKVVSVSFLYKYWQKVNLLMKTYMTIAAIVLMGITSAGAFGYLSNAFQKAIAGTNESAVMITALSEEQVRLQKRKVEIDAQIAKLPDNMVRGRTTLIRQFGPEVQRINNRLVEIDKELPKLKVETLKKNVEVGPIIYIAEAFKVTPEEAVKWVIFIIIFVFDPLAIALLLAGNFLIERHKEEKEDAGIQKFFDDGKAIAQTLDQAALKKLDEEMYANTVAALDKVNETSPEPPKKSYRGIGRGKKGPAPVKTPTVPSNVVYSPEYLPDTSPKPEDFPPAPSLAEPPINPEELEVQLYDPEETEEREIIRLDNVIKKPLHRSSLENVKMQDDITEDMNAEARLKPLRKVYNEENAVRVGGPSDRIDRTKFMTRKI